MGPGQGLDIQDELLFRGFTIYYQDKATIEAAYKDRYKEVADMFRGLEKEGWEK